MVNDFFDIGFTRRIRFEIVGVLHRYPWIYLPLANQFKRNTAGQKKNIDRQTQLVIEAFPRSANTFATTAFESSQPHPVRLAHHLHAPAQVMAAARRGVPCLVIIREPEEAVLSLAVWELGVTLSQILRYYVRFHRLIEPYRDRYVLARFEAVTTDFGRVTRAINDKFGTAFAEFDHTPANVEAVYETIAHRRIAVNRPADQIVPRPTATRKAAKDRIRPQLEAPKLARLRDQARRIYERLSAGAEL